MNKMEKEVLDGLKKDNQELRANLDKWITDNQKLLGEIQETSKTYQDYIKEMSGEIKELKNCILKMAIKGNR